MTTRDEFDRTSSGFDRLMTAWFDAESRVREPDDLFDRAIARSSKERPRPAWLLPERWLPMELTMRPVPVRRTATYLLLIGLLAALVLGAVLTVASRRYVPPPFGPADNGRIAIIRDGDVGTVDLATGETDLIIKGPETDRYPSYSLDGTRVAFVRKGSGGDDIYAVDARGGTPIRLTATPVANPVVMAWSPDGSKIAFETDHRLMIANTDGSGVKAIDLGMPVDGEIEWRPGRNDELAVRSTVDGKGALFLLRLDGSAPRAITPTDGDIYDYLALTWSADGRRLAYHRYPANEVDLVDVDDGGRITTIHPTTGLGIMFPRFSPDGTRLAAMAWNPDGSRQVAVFRSDDLTPELTLTGPVVPDTAITFEWSPDGTRILANPWDSTDVWELDPDGGPGKRTTWSAAFPESIEWQRLAVAHR